MSKSIVAPVQLDQIFVVDSRMHVEPNPAESMRESLDIHYDRGELAVEDDVATLALSLEVSVSLSASDEPSDVRMSAGTKVMVTAHCGIPQDGAPDTVKRYLTMNCLSVAYSHARSHLMSLTAASPMGTFMIPTILPSVLADADERERTERVEF